VQTLKAAIDSVERHPQTPAAPRLHILVRTPEQ
jgi:hypothetical protein